MPDGEVIAISEGYSPSVSVGSSNFVVSPVVNNGEESSTRTQNNVKDPRRIARKYQLELCKKALQENIIVYLETGCGKTHIAVLLIHELGHLIRSPVKSVCIFLAPTEALVRQQAKVIGNSVDFKVGIYCGSSNHLKNHHDWEKEIEQYEVLVMTPQILLNNLSHSFIKMEFIALLILDECHHAQLKSGHPYAQIMKVFYKPKEGKVPRIFGMTASPIVGKGASNMENLPKSINSLENILDAKVYSVENKEDLLQFVSSPRVNAYLYDPDVNGMSALYMTHCTKLEEIKHQCLSECGKNLDDRRYLQSLRSTKKALHRLHDNMIFCVKNLGLWGAWQACRLLLGDDHADWNAFIEAEAIGDDSVCDRYLAQAANLFSDDCEKGGFPSDLSSVELLKQPFFSKKLLLLIGILSNFMVQPNMKCIIFVNRIMSARFLSHVLQNVQFLASWKCGFLVGVHSGLKSMSRKTMNAILERFQMGELNLLVATKVGEEGLDIQTCCLVIRFDLPETVASFIQSRGRARMPQSEYAFLVDSSNEKEMDLIKSFKKNEEQMNLEISVRTSTDTFVSPEERVYHVEISGASVSSGYGISLLHHYCSKLPHDEYFNPRPMFYYFDDVGGTICHIILPSNAPLHQIVSTPQSSMDAAKKDACLRAIEQLHKLGALNNFLLPEQGNTDEEPKSSDSETCEDERGELHEMLVPAVLKESWSVENQICLNSYHIEFCPVPEDRTYKKFGLFLKAPLPQEAVRMELDLHLARGRIVKTKLIPFGLSSFNEDEIMQAQNFQEMFLKVILDRSEFVDEFVPLGKNGLSSSTFYLLLPIVLDDCGNGFRVDWGILRKCLSSPIFRMPSDSTEKKILPWVGYLQLSNGCRSISDIQNSLVYTPHKKEFHFITKIVHEKNAYSPHRVSSDVSHADNLFTTFNISLKHPEQPLLRAKPLFSLRNLLHNRRQEDSESQELEEYFVDLVPELCELKIIGFSKEIGSSISLLPSIMHRLENLLVAIELKCLLSASFPEGEEVSAQKLLEALTSERCQERLSLERLEILGDAFLKFAVGRYLFLLHGALDEGELTRRRSKVVDNSNLLKLANRRNLQVYIRDQPLEPIQFFACGRPCSRICTKDSEGAIHSQHGSHTSNQAKDKELRCSKGHHWLHKKTIADVVEALVGAFIVDSGFKAATAFLKWVGIKVDFEDSQVISVCKASNSYMPLAPNIDIPTLEKLLGYNFTNRGLLLQAFVHPSYTKHGGGCYQRLEFLGDAVVDFLITSYLFSVYPKLKPGHLTDLRSALVNNMAFANVAVDKSFHKFLISDSSSLSEAINDYVNFVKTLVPGRSLLEGPKFPKVLGDLLESCMGAIVLDTGFNLNHIWQIMLSFLDPIMSFSQMQVNPKRDLQELCQSNYWNLQFPYEKKGRKFFVEAKVNGADMSLTASASNFNRKEAEKTASEMLILKLKEQGHVLKSDSLEEVLRSSPKMEAKLIGYDETPIDVVSALGVTASDNLEDQELFGSEVDNTVSETSNSFRSHSEDASSSHSSSLSDFAGEQPIETITDSQSDKDLQTTGNSSNASARSRLFEICASYRWKCPLFECCHEEGPGHLKTFIFKVVVEIEEPSFMVLECFGAAKTKKKAAAEHAAEGALWYLQQEGYIN